MNLIPSTSQLIRRRRRRRAQGMTEYIIIVGLIAIALIGGVTKFKEALGGAYSAGSEKINGVAKTIGGTSNPATRGNVP